MLSLRKLFLSVVVPFLLVALASCGSKPGVVKVTGTLSYKGKPVTNAHLDFIPDSGRATWAETDDQGHFVVHYDRTQDGIAVGKNKVSIKIKQGAATEPGKPPVVPRDMVAFFDKYSPEKTTYEVTIDSNTKELLLDLE
jgi:hypothetical protein